jgi:hypothetical protein
MSFPGVDLGRFPGVLVLEARGDPGIQKLEDGQFLRS